MSSIIQLSAYRLSQLQSESNWPIQRFHELVEKPAASEGGLVEQPAARGANQAASAGDAVRPAGSPGPSEHDDVARQGRRREARHELALLCRDQGRTGVAETQWRVLLGESPDDGRAWLGLAGLLRHERRLPDAAVVCREGRQHLPVNLDLLLLHGLVLREQGDAAGAGACLLQVIEGTGGSHPAAKRRRATARHNLATLAAQGQRWDEAESHWRAATTEVPDFVMAWLGLGEVCLACQRWPELDTIAARLEEELRQPAEAAVLQARARLDQRDFAAARRLLEAAIARSPQAVWPRLILSHVLLQEGRDPAAAERALRAVLALDPHHSEARARSATRQGSSRATPGSVVPLVEP